MIDPDSDFWHGPPCTIPLPALEPADESWVTVTPAEANLIDPGFLLVHGEERAQIIAIAIVPEGYSVLLKRHWGGSPNLSHDPADWEIHAP